MVGHRDDAGAAMTDDEVLVVESVSIDTDCCETSTKVSQDLSTFQEYGAVRK